MYLGALLPENLSDARRSASNFCTNSTFSCDGEKCRVPVKEAQILFRDTVVTWHSLFLSYISETYTTRIPLSDTVGTYRDDGIIKAQNFEMMEM